MKYLLPALLVGVVLGVGCTSTPASTPSSAPASTPSSALRSVHDPGQVTGTIQGPCHAHDNGQLPDSRCTPGAIDPAVTQANIAVTICHSGYTATVRPPESQTERFKFSDAFTSYGILQGTTTELDHLVPLELGGANDAANLWPEVGSVPNRKDQVERALNRAVCDGKVSLVVAQIAIATDWESVKYLLRIKQSTPRPTVPRQPSRRATHSPATRGCYPKAPSGNCYEPGEFCATADAGMTGVAGNGATIVCKLISGRYHWED